MALPLKISTPQKEGTLQVSKSRKLPMLIDGAEIQELFSVLGDFSIFDVSRPVDLHSMEFSKEDFLNIYGSYVAGIREGKLFDETLIKPYFSAVFTQDREQLYAIKLSNGKYLIKAKRPVIQLQRHHFIYSDDFHSGVMGEKSITWGIQFSYPQLFLDPETKAIGKVDKSAAFPNTALFAKLTKWVRDYTSATPFVVDGKKRNQPMRLGKNCFSWINNHPGLKERGLYVERRNHSQISH